MPVDSSLIDAALLARLDNDALLMAILTDGVYFDEARQNAQKFLIVSLLDHVDESVFGGRAIESALYLVKAVTLGPSGDTVKSAAARIDVLLEDQPLTVAGYTWMSTHREARIRKTEVDQVDTAIRWQHRGGHYRVEMSVVGM